MSKLFRQQAAYLREENKKYPATLAPIDITDKPVPEGCIAVWRSSRFLVQLFEPGNGAQRISLNRTMVDDRTGCWIDGITWEEIQQVKAQLGYGDRHAVEVYPPDADVVNVANMRHIWLVDAPAFAWSPKP